QRRSDLWTRGQVDVTLGDTPFRAPGAPEGPSAAPTGVPARLIAVLALAAAGPIALLFASRFRQLYELWSIDDNYSHGFLVPFVSGCLAWGVYQRQGWPERGNYPLGGLLLGLGCLLRLTTVVVGLPLLDFVALAAMLFGLAVMVGGVRWAWGFAF